MPRYEFTPDHLTYACEFLERVAPDYMQYYRYVEPENIELTYAIELNDLLMLGDYAIRLDSKREKFIVEHVETIPAHEEDPGYKDPVLVSEDTLFDNALLAIVRHMMQLEHQAFTQEYDKPKPRPMALENLWPFPEAPRSKSTPTPGAEDALF